MPIPACLLPCFQSAGDAPSGRRSARVESRPVSRRARGARGRWLEARALACVARAQRFSRRVGVAKVGASRAVRSSSRSNWPRSRSPYPPAVIAAVVVRPRSRIRAEVRPPLRLVTRTIEASRRGGIVRGTRDGPGRLGPRDIGVGGRGRRSPAIDCASRSGRSIRTGRAAPAPGSFSASSCFGCDSSRRCVESWEFSLLPAASRAGSFGCCKMRAAHRLPARSQ